MKAQRTPWQAIRYQLPIQASYGMSNVSISEKMHGIIPHCIVYALSTTMIKPISNFDLLKNIPHLARMGKPLYGYHECLEEIPSSIT